MDSTKKVVLVVLELKEPSAQYSALYDYLKGHIGWSHYLPAMWLVATDKTLEEVGEGVKALIFPSEKGGDRYMVVDITKSEHRGWGPKAMWDWLRKHRGEVDVAQPELPKL